MSEFEAKGDIEIQDSEADSFLEMLRYIYSDEVKLDASNVMGTLYLSKKYILPTLTEKCIEFLEQNMDHQNTFTLLSQARYFGEPKLEEQCWKIIDENTTKVLNSEAFTEVDHDTLQAVVEREALTVNEATLFKAVRRWAEKECVRREITIIAENMRKVLSSALNHIRFPVMTIREFSEDAAQSGILTSEETISVFLYFGSKEKEKVVNFPIIPRAGSSNVFRCTRFKSYGPDWYCEGTNVDSVKFSCDTAITVLGIGVYGASHTKDSQHTYRIDVELVDSHNEVLRAFQGNFNVEDNKQVHDITFSETFKVEEGRSYIIRVLLKGPPTLGGNDGMREVTCEGVRFRFEVDETSFNGTTTSDGQIPEIIFRL